MKSESTCNTCGERLSGRQRRFCSRTCKNRDTNNRHQNYACQQDRGLTRKQKLLALAGSCCAQCGYGRNPAALVWQHLDPGKKSFSMDLRSLSNRKYEELADEAAKCIVLCANCHAEAHFPHLAIDRLDAKTAS